MTSYLHLFWAIYDDDIIDLSAWPQLNNNETPSFFILHLPGLNKHQRHRVDNFIYSAIHG